MQIRQILSTQDVNVDYIDAAAWLLDKFRYRLFVLRQDSDFLVLPVTPEKYSVTTEQHNKTYDILDTGEALIFGNAKLKKLKFSSFFPRLYHKYPFVNLGSMEAAAYVDKLTKWKEAKAAVRVIITDSPLNLAMAIMDFDWKERDGSRDIDYTLSFTEYRDLNTPPSNNDRLILNLTGLRERP